MNSQQAHYFITLANTGSFSKAAKVLFVSQPSLSQFVKNLELQLETTLFDRSTSPLKLTQSGQVYYNAAKKMIELETDLIREINDIEDKKTGTLTIGTTPFRAACMLPKSIAVFQENFPGIKIDIVTDTLENLNSMLLKSELDLCIDTNVFDQKSIITEELSLETLYLAIPPSYHFNDDKKNQALSPEDIKYSSDRLFDEKGIFLDECRNLPFITLKSEDSFTNKTKILCGAFDFEPRVVLSASNIEMMFHWVRFGIGVALLPDTLIKFGDLAEHPVYYKIAEPENQFGLTSIDIVTAYKRERHLSSASKEYILTLKKLISLGTWNLNS